MHAKIDDGSGSAGVQGKLWGGAARDWAALQEPLTTPLWAAMLDGLGVGAGTRLLDAGCGAGGAAVLAAARGARVSGLDAAEGLLAVARERLPAADLRAGDLQFLPWDDGSFAAVFAANAVQYARDPWAAMRELARVAATGGRVAIGSWGDPEHCEMRHVLRAVAASLPTPPPGKGPFALAEPGALERLVTDAGLSVAARGQADCPFEYETEDLFWRAQRSAGPLQAALGQVEEARLRAAVVASVAPYRTARGGVRLENRFVFVVAGKV